MRGEDRRGKKKDEKRGGGGKGSEERGEAEDGIKRWGRGERER